MGINVTVDEELLAQACKLTGETDLTKVIERALNEVIRRRSKLESLLEVAGKVEFYDGYDYKARRAGHDDNS